MTEISEDDAFLSFFEEGASTGDAAQAYAALKMFVLPLKPASKQPASKNGLNDATTNVSQIKRWYTDNPEYNVGINLRRSGIVVLDVDPRNGGNDTLQACVDLFGPLPPTYSVKSGGGGHHYYFRVSPDWYENNDLPKKLGDGLELLTNHYAVAPPSRLETGFYRVSAGTLEEPFATAPFSWLDSAAKQARKEYADSRWDTSNEDWTIERGSRNETLTSMAGVFRARGANAEEIEQIFYAFRDRIEGFEEIEDELKTIAQSVARYPISQIGFEAMRLVVNKRRGIPVLSDDALIGPIGDWIRYIEPNTETHPAALLSQALTAFGNIIGARKRSDYAPGFIVESAEHRTALYCAIVGASAKAGKGDSWNQVEALMKHVDPTWRRVSGVQTGEGLIDALADDEELDKSMSMNGEEVPYSRKGNEDDKRYMVIEPEFGRTLHSANRMGSTLKDVLRELWDQGRTQKITAGSKQRVSDATVSLVGHITKAELQQDMSMIDLLSGFGNRFLWVFTSRTKTLTSAKKFTKKELKPFWAPLQEALAFARDEAPNDYEWTRSAQKEWSRLTHQYLKEGRTAITDALGARARPIVRRLAVIYAVSECSDIIELSHLKAAAALWEYCEDTVDYLFGESVGDKIADKIMTALHENPSGLTRTEISTNVLKGNYNSPRIDIAMQKLKERGLILIVKADRGGRSKDVYLAVRHDTQAQ